MEKMKLELTAAILNNEKEAEVYDWLALTVPEYTGQFNKRFETWLNKKASERFGTEVYKNWGMNGEDKEYPKISFYLHKSDYQLTDTPKFEFSFNYKGKTVSYDYENKTTVIRDQNENEKLFGIAGTADIVEWAERVAKNRRENVEKMQSNLRELPKLIAEHDKLKADIEKFNDKISYAISDSMRIKG